DMRSDLCSDRDLYLLLLRTLPGLVHCTYTTLFRSRAGPRAASPAGRRRCPAAAGGQRGGGRRAPRRACRAGGPRARPSGRSSASDRKSTRLNSSHVSISYAVFCLKKKTNEHIFINL